ncbi:DUF7619 domain-containing protein [Flavobacterium akiainvivens]|nr:T9SS type A sorting domain-containing protein [Flavobacterium akiainvivens]SFQ41230.1 Por secretion system C-terminal sorting domain-containing protein [Flavobacterium akiainvivens]
MKKFLLTLAFAAFCSLGARAQATAYEVDEISQCMYEVFDLAALSPVILGDQNPDEYSVTFFTTEANANANTAAITNPQAYIINGWQQTIWVRVENNANGDYDVDDFIISMHQGIEVPEFDDVVTCGSFILPFIQWPSLYYTEPNMGGTPLQSGTAITTSQTIYIHAVNGVCNDESSFTVTITGNGPALVPPNPLIACDEDGDGFETFDLATLVEAIESIEGIDGVTVHETFIDAENGTNPVPSLSSYISPVMPQIVTVYIRAVAGSGCITILPLQLIVTECNLTGNSFSGTVKYDGNNDGCDGNDNPAAGVWVSYTHENTTYYAYTDANGYYEFTNVPDGESYVSVEAIPGFNVSPQSMAVTFPGNDPIDNDFCITAAAPVQDILVYIYPSTFAVPGFETAYVVVLQNLGTTTVSGSITIQYDASNLAYIPSPGFTQSGNMLTVNYTDLSAFETQYFYFSGTLAAPPALNIGDVITFTAVANPLTGDANPDNNTYVLDHQIVNSYDPNDITCREGEFITEEQADGYLHYMVRFQNTGTFPATNVRVEGILDDKLDWDTFEPINASHNYQAYRTEDNIKFMFDTINLPDSTSNEAASHGYVIYKIKPKASVQVGDTMSAQVGIYFDFNTAVITNTYNTTIETMAIDAVVKETFALYPNPANNSVNIKLQDTVNAGVIITDVLDKTVLKSQVNGEVTLDVSALNSGVYFVTVQAGSTHATQKLVVK